MRPILNITPRWVKELKKVKQQPQTQENLDSQLVKMYAIANKFGLYDAADFIKNIFNDKSKL